MASADLFDAYFKRADLDGDGQISGAEAVAFFQGSGLPKHVLAEVWTHADQRKAGYLGRQEFYNALKLVTVAQSKRELTPEIVKAALYGPASAKIPAPQINLAATPAPRPATPAPQNAGTTPVASQGVGVRPQFSGNGNTIQSYPPSQQNQFMRPGQPTSSHSQQVLASQGFSRGSTVAAPRPPTPNASTGWAAGSTGVPTTQSQSGRATSPVSGDGFGLMTSGLVNSAQPRPLVASGPSPLMPSIQPRPQVFSGQVPSPQPRPQVTPGQTPLVSPSQPRPPAVTANTHLVPSVQPRPQVTAVQAPSTTPKPPDSAFASNHPAEKHHELSGNGVATDSIFGDVFSATPAQSVPASAATATSATSSVPVSSSIVSFSDATQPKATTNSLGNMQNTFSQQSVGVPTAVRGNHSVSAQNASPVASSALSTATSNLSSSQPQPPWPKMTHADIQKYMKVFVQVDTDRDGKITGEQARNLFLSWKLSREVLKQVWTLSDQDNDNMLSLREFCVALYLMERFIEGRTLPAALPSSVMSDEILLSATSHLTAAHGAGAWTHASGMRPPHAMTGPRPPPGVTSRPPRPPSSHHADEKPPVQRKPKIPVLEKHLVDQLSQEEQDSLNLKFQEAAQAEKKVEELEKEIAESRQKIEFCRAKMQELVLYKSRCDNRLNEVTERVAADKREVETLAKKYEEKYKQIGDVASKLTIEEATFRDIQEKKMELYRAIVKMEEGATDDGVLKERVGRIQSGLEELVKQVNERCKQYGLRAKPISLVELPFGWQPGIQEGAADWDEDWDKFADEGFTFVKELTLEVQNVVAPPKPKWSIEKITVSANDESKVDVKSERSPTLGEHDKESINDHSENNKAGSPLGSPASRSGIESHPQNSSDSPFREGTSVDGSPHAKEIHKDGSGEEPRWGTFDDTHIDSESLWGFDSESGKDANHDRNSDFGLGEFKLNPLKLGSSHSDNTYQGMSKSIFADSVPSTPAENFGRNVFADSVPSTPAYNQGKSTYSFDSVPSTPAYNQGKSTYTFDSVPSTPAYKSSFGFADSVPGTPAYKSSFGFADSVPGTPAYNFNFDDHSFDSLSRFDSFNLQEGGSSQPNSFARFDSMRSTSDQSQGFPSRFDSFREPHEADQGQGFSRFDSFRDSDQSQGFSRFDSFRDTDSTSHGFPSRFDSFRENDSNSHGFASSFDSGDHSNAFSRFDSFNANDSHGSSGNAFARFDSVRGSRDFDSSHRYSFEDADPFGSTGPFKTSFDSETPRKSTDNWKSF